MFLGIEHDMFVYVSRSSDVLQNNMNFCVGVRNGGHMMSFL